MRGRVLFFKYIASFLAVMLVSFLLLSGYLALYTAGYFSRQTERGINLSARALAESISAGMELSRQDFEGLIEEHRALFVRQLNALRTEEESVFFITNNAGRVLISTDETQVGTLLSSEEMESAIAHGKTGETFVAEFPGLFSSPRRCRVVLMEKTYSETSKQRVGAVFLTFPASTLNDFSKNLLISFFLAALFLLCVVLMLFFWIARKLMMPLELLNDAAKAYAQGDFSWRIPEEESGELRPLSRALNQMASLAQEHEKTRQMFISNISHELRTPLTTISGFVQNMKAGAILPESQDRYFTIILDEVNRLSRLVQTLLETSRMSEGKREYHMAPFDLCELGRITLLSFESRLEEKRVDVSFLAEKDAMFVTADRDAIAQVIYNLIDNAAKFTPTQGTLSVRVQSPGKDKVIFSVKNTGSGISKDEISHLFDRFYKADTSRGLDKTGMGLGLFIARSIIQAHGEEIWVESVEGKYAEFFFSLPTTSVLPTQQP